MDWSRCSDVERISGKISGDWLVKGTRVQADAVIANAEAGYTAEEIVDEIFEGLPVEQARRIIAFARRNVASAA